MRTLSMTNPRPVTPVMMPLAQRARLSAFRGVFVRPIENSRACRRSAVFSFEVAATPHMLQWGLSRRASLPVMHGMLFDFGEPGLFTFWGRDTLLHLDLAFLDENGRIFELREIKPGDLTHVKPSMPARYGVEVGFGVFAKERVSVGDELHALEVPPPPPQPQVLRRA